VSYSLGSENRHELGRTRTLAGLYRSLITLRDINCWRPSCAKSCKIILHAAILDWGGSSGEGWRDFPGATPEPHL
jgi:hypothetical protein